MAHPLPPASGSWNPQEAPSKTSEEQERDPGESLSSSNIFSARAELSRLPGADLPRGRWSGVLALILAALHLSRVTGPVHAALLRRAD